jgi:uncharacterized protein YneF (UPF0154 family)
MTELLLLAGTIVALFSTTLLRSVQNKNVAGNHKKMAFIFGTGMSACELLVMGLVASSQNYMFMLLGAVGSGIGWVAGMYMHDRMMRKKLEEQKRLKKKKRNNRIRTISRDEIDERLQELGII